MIAFLLDAEQVVDIFTVIFLEETVAGARGLHAIKILCNYFRVVAMYCPYIAWIGLQQR